MSPRAALGRLPVAVSHPDKVFWPTEGYTKLDLVRFYDRIFPHLRPYVAGRLLTLERCPDGLRGQCFYQREAPRGMPAATPTKRVRDATGTTTYVVGGRRDTQAALTNLGCIAVHVWGSRAVAPRRPDWVCFDLDPTSGEFADAARAGQRVRTEMTALGLTSFPKTSGSRGLHVFVPLRAGPDVDEVLAFAEAVVRHIAAGVYTWIRFGTGTPKPSRRRSRCADAPRRRSQPPWTGRRSPRGFDPSGSTWETSSTV